MTSNTQNDSNWLSIARVSQWGRADGDTGLCRPEELPSCKHIMTVSLFLEFQIYKSKVPPAFVFPETKEPERVPGSRCIMVWGRSTL